jgi:hypothetical protein
MLECPRCATQVTEEAVFCPSCGARLSPSEAQPATPPPPPAALPSAAPRLRLGDYLQEGWELFKRCPGLFVGFFATMLLINIVLGMIPILGIIINTLISGPLIAGFFIVSFKLRQNQTPEFKDFFGGFNFFVPLLVASFLTSIFVALGTLLFVLPGVYLAVAYLFVTPLIVDRALDFWPAMELSRHTVNPNWFSMFGLLLLLLVVNLLGTLALVVGLLVTVPVSFCAVAAAYADICGVRSDYAGSKPTLP